MGWGWDGDGIEWTGDGMGWNKGGVVEVTSRVFVYAMLC